MSFNKNILFIIFLSGISLFCSDEALNHIVEVNKKELEKLKKDNEELFEINKKLQATGLDPEDLIDLQSKKAKLKRSVPLASDLENPFGDLIEKIEDKNLLINTLIEKEFFKTINDAGFVVDENQVVNYIKLGRKKPNVSFKKSIQLEKLIPLIPSVTLESEKYNRFWSYYSFSSYYFGLIATAKKLRNKVPVFIQNVSKLNDDNKLDKLETLVLIFAKAQIMHYKQLAAKEFKELGFNLKSNKKHKNFLVQRYATDFVSLSSPTLIATRALYQIESTLFDSGKVYLKKIEDAIKSNFDFDDKNRAYFYEEFIRAVKENKVQYVWRNYSGYVFRGGSVIFSLLILAKKYQWYVKLQELLNKYRNK